MSSSAEIQKLVFDTLTASAPIMAIANGVYDRVPQEPFGARTACISFGPEDTQDDGADCIAGLKKTLQIDIWSRAPGFVECKTLTDLVRKALHRKPLALSVNAMVDVEVDLVRVFRDPDGETSHGVVQVMFTIEETS